ncbi:hypothetical protein ACDW_04490 [Acidovorax sp. DW039]|uniref:hypothetical protein n=1 Tax=Acidovorax sp. DW039 TaxID=3095606 RepID=UPI003090868F|nr:hypothetical protein ACDW_04490 [Acidovorax sp. DW039]
MSPTMTPALHCEPIDTSTGATCSPHSDLPATPPWCAGLAGVEQLQLNRHRRALWQALAQQDRQALRTAKQAVLTAAYGCAAPAPLRRALRELAWRMVALHAGIPKSGSFWPAGL